jgi:hypothetical protein
MRQELTTTCTRLGERVTTYLVTSELIDNADILLDLSHSNWRLLGLGVFSTMIKLQPVDGVTRTAYIGDIISIGANGTVYVDTFEDFIQMLSTKPIFRPMFTIPIPYKHEWTITQRDKEED